MHGIERLTDHLPKKAELWLGERKTASRPKPTKATNWDALRKDENKKVFADEAKESMRTSKSWSELMSSVAETGLKVCGT